MGEKKGIYCFAFKITQSYWNVNFHPFHLHVILTDVI